MDNLQNIYKHKGSDIAVYLGSGSSINKITKNQWKKIATVDTWTVNNWVYHPFIPKFYHVEVKKYNKDIVKRRIAQRGNAYNDTVFIVNKDRPYLLDVIGKKKYTYLYKMDKINTENKAMVPNYTSSKDPNILTCNLNTSFTMMLELLYKFGYEKVIFFGVDLSNSLYFWTNRKEYGETHCQWNKDHEGTKPDQPHNTMHVKDFVVWFSEKRMAEIGGQFFVGHKNTALYPDLKYSDIETVGYNKTLRYEALAELAGVEEGKDIIDCSCGNGEEGRVIIQRFKPKKYVGVDLDKKQVAKAKEENPKMADCYVCGDIKDLLNDQFDYYFCIETLEHLAEEDNKKVEKVIFDTLKPGGKLLISVPGNPKLVMEDKRHKQIMNKKLLVNMFSRFSLEAEDIYIKYLPRKEAYNNFYVFRKGRIND